MKLFGNYWEVVHAKTGQIVNSGFEKGDDLSSGEMPDKNVKGFIYRVILLYAQKDWDAQQAMHLPMTDDQIQEIYIRTYNIGHHGRDFENAFARAIEAHHGIHAPK